MRVATFKKLINRAYTQAAVTIQINAQSLNLKNATKAFNSAVCKLFQITDLYTITILQILM